MFLVSFRKGKGKPMNRIIILALVVTLLHVACNNNAPEFENSMHTVFGGDLNREDDYYINDGRPDLIDCNKPDALMYQDCHGENNCTDGIDNDFDGFIDCDDLDCENQAACYLFERCRNEMDDDGDGLTDCTDPACKNHQACTM